MVGGSPFPSRAPVLVQRKAIVPVVCGFVKKVFCNESTLSLCTRHIGLRSGCLSTLRLLYSTVLVRLSTCLSSLLLLLFFYRTTSPSIPHKTEILPGLRNTLASSTTTLPRLPPPTIPVTQHHQEQRSSASIHSFARKQAASQCKPPTSWP